MRLSRQGRFPMAERSFELELERLFAEPPAYPDAEAFARRIGAVLDRGWGFRRVLIGGLGLIGGLIGAAQVVSSGLIERVGALDAPAHVLISSGLSRLPIARAATEIFGGAASMDSEVLWMSAAMAVLAVGLFITRTLREF